ncbi:DUF4142 domain-containing protein [Nonomuraea spiralis]|uniref:DUF4142 domain-containing protein n=1 Tax=Nonomuraea TaxID=83681 RepID=UPI000F7A58DA|nr:DUF4142 domain-containing protein [Nonomuraea sp. WAC 01424]RSN06742.1 hypothetical protein DMB42_26155 [Nonomuraea sp. WAC 01424]
MGRQAQVPLKGGTHENSTEPLSTRGNRGRAGVDRVRHGTRRGNLAEIAAGKAALRRSHDKDVREIAWGLIRDHRKLDARLREVAQRLRVDLPDAPAAEQRDDLDAVLARRSGHRFDRAWLRLQADAHEQTLTLIRRELRHGHSGWVRDLARDGAPVVRHHLDEVRAELNRHAH